MTAAYRSLVKKIFSAYLSDLRYSVEEYVDELNSSSATEEFWQLVKEAVEERKKNTLSSVQTNSVHMVGTSA